MNEDVLKMIDTLHARLDDVRVAVESLSYEAPSYAQKLDKIDDKLYLLQVEIEKDAAASESAQGSDSADSVEVAPAASDEAEDSSEASDAKKIQDAEAEEETPAKSAEAEEQAPAKAAGGDETEEAQSAKKGEGESGEKKQILSDDMKANLADAGRAIGSIYRDGKEVITELSGTVGDIKDIFNFKKKR